MTFNMFDPLFVIMYHSENPRNENDLIENVFLYQNPLKYMWGLQNLQIYDYFSQLVGYKWVNLSTLIRNPPTQLTLLFQKLLKLF